ncbi:DUF3857 domain-containing protein [Flagellimonas zhangzhouensis]|uniref:Transglutaminase-like superfamily protein n=1 Tax=Flagellimonas zhangzhouensis TaxID=1073328 RepID=A0A1H2X884_9FLAO|nr:DUF3857 domain-containing protein [Allomuricauda zhangzhouensis]SDQ29216.1 Transglutaminase-like superfamily protein [Allomuricauda zhangzhouensis]SDW88966.1 protein of unknown function [Allomuricauda zhangzhouensis]
MRFFALTFFIFFSNFFHAQYSVKSIPENLLTGADAVLRKHTMDVVVLAQDKMEIRYHRVVTVLNEDGDDKVDAYAYYEKNDKISTLEAIVYNANGNEIKKFKKKDFLDQSAISGGTLYSDSRVMFLNYTPIQYPYTIEFIQEYTTPNTAFTPTWPFLDDYNVSTELSEFDFRADERIQFRYQEQNFDGYQISSSSTSNELHYKAKNIEAIKSEPMSPSFRDFAPHVKVGLNKFHLEGVDGAASNWNELGQWIYDQLIIGRDKLDPNTIIKVQNLVKGVEDDYEKTRLIYEYVQANTRYINVKLGIGGWMPMSAEEVDRVKYGDCKGLTNYTKALLSAVGVNSYYTVVYGDEQIRSLDNDFASMQGNHVFLNVPINGEDIWLECTSQTVPMNHLGTFTDNRYVLKITPEGGQLVKTRESLDEGNYQKTTGEYTVNSDQSIKGKAVIVSSGTQYDQKYWLKDQPKKEQEDFYKRYFGYINNLTLEEVSFQNNKNEVEFVENVSIKAGNYLSSANDQLILILNVFNRNLRVPSKVRNRQKDVVISRGYLDEDEYLIHLPEGFEPEELMKPKRIDNKFGTYEVALEKVDSNTLRYKRKLLVKSGNYPKEDYEKYRDFRKKVVRGDNTKILLNKKNKT